MKRIKIFFISGMLMFFLAGVHHAHGTTYNCLASGNWNASTIWLSTPGGLNGVPVSGDIVNIGGYSVTVTAPAACSSITFTASGATLTVNTGISLTVSGAITLNSASGTSYSTTLAGAGTITCSSLAVGTNVNPSIDRTTTLTTTISTLAISGSLSLFNSDNNNYQNDAIFNLSSGTVTVNGSISSTYEDTGQNFPVFTMATGSQNGTLNLGGATPFSLGSGTTTTTLAGTSTLVNYTYSGVQLVRATTYTNLTVSGSGQKTTTGITVNGVLSMEGSATMSAAPSYGSNAKLQYNTSTSRVTGVEWNSPFAATGGVVIANTGIITLNNARVLNASVPLSISNGATLATGNFQLTLGGNFTNSGTFTAGSSPVIITDVMTAQSIAGFTTTGLVSMTKTWGTATLQGNVNAGGLAINGSGGTLHMGTGLSHVFSGSVTHTGNTLNGGTNVSFTARGNWTRTGGVFSAGTSTVILDGSAAQSLNGSTSTTFNNLTINNSSGITLSNNEIITGILTLTNGILNIGTNTLTTTNSGSTSITGGSDVSFVNGPLIRTLAAGQNYNFPVGEGTTYLPFAISTVTGTTPQIRVEAFSGSAGGSPASPLTFLSTTEYWQASVTSGTYSGGSVSITRQIPPGEFEAIGRSATLTGTYANLQGTVSGTSIINSNNTGNSLGFFLMATYKSIATGTISPVILCPGSPVDVPFTITGTFNAGNVFTAQLSNAAGSFSSPVNIGTLASQNAGTINATIPGGQPLGSGYRIRVVSSSPVITGTDNGTNLTLAYPVISSTFPGSRCGPGAVTISATASSGTINWYATLTGGSSLGTGPTFTTPVLNSTTTYYVDATLGNCTSTPRIPVLAIIIAPPTINAEGGGTFCAGSNITLTSSGTNVTNQYWTGPNNFYSLEQNPVLSNATPAMSGTYTITGSALSGVNLLNNGDFELGNTGFSSSYTVSTDLTPEGRYAVIANPNTVHPSFINCTDHTPSGTLQMVINGAIVAGVNVWSQTVNVSPNTDYQFTYWVQSVVQGNPSQLQLYANGVPAGPVYIALTPTCQWKQFIYNWNSGSSTTVLLSLLNQNTIASGNDFALDDVVFQQVCPAISGDMPVGFPGPGDAPTGTSVVVIVNAAVTAGTIGNAQSICRGVTPSAITSITAGTGSGTISYEWQTNATGSYVTIPGATATTYAPPALNATTSYQRRTVSFSGGITCYSPYTTAITITVTGPLVVAGGPNAACQSASPAAITLTGASVTGGTAAWSIVSGGGSLSSTAQTSTPAAVTYTPGMNVSGTVTLRLTSSSVGGCVMTGDRTISISPVPGAIAGTPVTTCSNSGAVNITTGASATNYSSITWSSGGTGIFTNANSLTTAAYTPSAADITAGSVTLILTVYGLAPCGNTLSTKTLTISPNLIAGISISASANPACTGSEIVFTAVPVNGGSSPVYQWKLNGANVGTNSSTYSSATLSNGDIIQCYMTSNALCISGSPATSNAITLTIGTPSVLASSTETCLRGSTGTITASGSAGQPPYTYRLNSGTYQASGLFTGLAAGTYTVTVRDNIGCTFTSSAVVNSPAPSTDDQTDAGSDSWIGHVYDGTNFNSYFGHYTENELFDQNFGGAYVCFPVLSNGTSRSIYDEQFSVRYRMNSTHRGLYVVNLGSDDGSRLTVDGSLIYNNWTDQAFSTRTGVLMSLTGSSALIYDFYENLANNRVIFQGLTQVLSNTLNTNTTQTICTGNTGVPVSGDIFGTLPSGISLSGSGYQWTYSTTPSGTRINIAGATNASYTPSTLTSPFDVPGTYYLYRNAVLRSTNNVSPNPYIASNESNAATITVNLLPAATVSYSGSPFCETIATPQPVTVTGTPGGTFSSTAGLSINSATGEITPAASNAGTYTVTYTMAAPLGCEVVTTATIITITSMPAATIIYPGTPFCNTLTTPQNVTLTGVTGGTFSSTAGLTINPTTGAITPSTSTPGTYTVTYTIAASGGCGVVTTTTQVTITGSPVATFFYPGTPYCLNAANPVPTFTGGGTAGTFSSTAGLVLNTATGQITLATSVPGTYTVTNTIIASGGCSQVIATSPVTLNPTLPVAISISASANPVCSGTSVTFTATPANGGATPAYQWKVNGVNAGTNSATYVYSPVNNDIVTCVLTSSTTCATGNPATSNAVTMTVNPNLPVSVSIAASANPVCSGTSVTFTATPANGGATPAYQWKVNGVNAGTNSAVYSFTPANNDLITCELTSSASPCASGNPATSSPITMTVNPVLPVSIVISASANPVCDGDQVTFTAVPFNGGTTPGFQWKVNGTNAGTGSTTFTYAPADNDIISCVLTSDATCASGNPASSNAVNMTVNPYLPVSVSIAASENPICSGTSVTFTATPINGGVSPSYQWKVNGTDAGTDNPTFTYTPLNNDAVTCILTSSAAICATGNPATSNSVIMTVNLNIPASVSVTATPTGTICSGTPVSLSASAIPTSPQPVLISEGFNDPTNNWTTINNSVGGSVAAAAWILRPDGYISTYSGTIHSNDASQFYFSNSDDQGTGTTTSTILQSPVMNTVDYTSLSLNFFHYFRVYLPGETGKVQVSTNGTTWVDVFTYTTNQGAPTAFSNATINLNAFLGNTIFYVRFKYDAAWGYYWAIDNVTVSGTPLTTNYTYSWTAVPPGTAGLPAGAGIPSAANQTISVNPSASTTYTVTASSGYGCDKTNSTSVAVTPMPTATISYAGSPFCTSVATAQPVTITGSGTYTGGIFTAPAGLYLNQTTGEITPASSTAGTYTVTYTIPEYEGCPAIPVTTDVTITELPVTTFSYTGSPYCNNESDPLPTFSGGGVAGVFSSSPGLVFISTTTGEVDLSASTPGTYPVTNTIAPSGGCEEVSTTSTITINPMTPATPGAINGTGNQCPGLTDQVYSIVPVANASLYTWSVPIGWTITSGAGTSAITVTTGSPGQNGDITVTAGNACGTSAPATMAVSVYQVEVIATLGSLDACYPTVKEAFDNINNGYHKGAIIIKIHGSTIETASAVLYANGTVSSSFTSLLIYPTVTCSVSGNFTNNLIELNGADNVTIDGRVNQLGSVPGLSFSQSESANANSRTFHFLNSAENNVIKYCNIQGSCISTSAGIILFSTSTGGNGNDNNAIEFCDITNAGGNRPVNAIYSSGSTSYINSENRISNNNFYDFLNPGIASNGISLAANTSAWTISDNSFYETSSFIPTGDVAYYIIRINNPSGSNFTVLGNFMGGKLALCGGASLEKTNRNNVFYGIYMNVGTTPASNIQNNTIQNISWSNSGAADWTGIHIAGGNVNIGTATGNILGSATGTASITVTDGANSNFYGINIASTGTVDCQNNLIGSITAANATTFRTHFYGINKINGGTTTLSYNTIGSETTANSINASSFSTGNSQNVIGINTTSNGTIIISNNTIANLTNSSTQTSGSGRVNGITSTNGTNTIENNTIHDLTTANQNTSTTTAAAAVCGIALTGATLKTVSGNTIYNLSSTFATFTGGVIGIYFTGGTGNSVSGNFIHSLSVAPTSLTASLFGIRIAAGTTTYFNNIISLGGNNRMTMYGIYETGAAGNNNSIYFNTIYIEGSPSAGALNSYAFYSYSSANTRNIRNNIFNNSRSNTTATGKHYAAYFNYGVSTNLTLDYNDYYAPGTNGRLGYYGGADKNTLPIVTGQDLNSQIIDPTFTSPGGTLPANYNISVNLIGFTIAGITTDFGGTNRGEPPTMGAWEKMLRKWKGSVSTNFAVGGNWTDGIVPSSGESIIFDDDPDRDCYLDEDRIIGNLTINQPVDRMVLNGFQLSLNGSLLLTNTGQIDATSSGSTIAFTGTSSQSIGAGNFKDNLVYNFLLANNNGVSLAGNLTVTGELNLSNGILTLGSGTLGIDGTLIRTGGSVTAGTGSTVSIGGTSPQLSIPANSFTGNSVDNFSIVRAAGAVLNSNLSVSGVLGLQAQNPSSTQGCLETGSNTLSMGATATTIGAGDVNGLVSRTSFTANTYYTFGNQFTTLTFPPDGTLPAAIVVKITLGIAPAWKPDAILRTYDIIRTGGSGTGVTMNLHYLDSELNGNPENDLYSWDYHATNPVMLEKHPRDGQNISDNWLETFISDVSYFGTAFDEHPWTLAKSIFVTFMGTKGWRMITAPTLTTCADLLSGFITQGVPGSTYPEKQPNFLWFDETDTLTTNMSWRTSIYDQNLVRGRGYYFYVFDSVSGIYSDTLPRPLTASGNTYFPGTFAYAGANQPVTFTPRVGGQTNLSLSDTIFYDTNIDDQGWNLMGNPTISTLNWDAAQGWTKTNLDNTIYIWDPATNQFRYWNGINGTLENGLISPFQGFWVRANTANPVFGFTDDVLTTGGTFYGGTAVKSKPVSAAPSAMNLSLTSAGLESTIFVSFKEDGTAGPDTWDAYRLEPLSNSWMEFFTLSSPSHTMPLVINNLPTNTPDCINLPLYVGGQLGGNPLAGTYTINWSLPPDWPSDWAISLNDHSTKKAISMKRGQNYTFNVDGVTGLKAGIRANDLDLPPEVIDPVSAHSKLKGSSELPPFSIVIEKNNSGDDPMYFAPEPTLIQNYPNPFSLSTTLRFSLPVGANVSLKVYDIYGKLLDIVTDRYYETGIYTIPWNRNTFKPGIYILQMKAGDVKKAIKMVII